MRPGRLGCQHRMPLGQRLDHLQPILHAAGDPVDQQQQRSAARLHVAHRPAVERDGAGLQARSSPPAIIARVRPGRCGSIGVWHSQIGSVSDEPGRPGADGRLGEQRPLLRRQDDNLGLGEPLAQLADHHPTLDPLGSRRSSTNTRQKRRRVWSTTADRSTASAMTLDILLAVEQQP